MKNGAAVRKPGAFRTRTLLRFCCLLIVMLFTAAAAAGEDGTLWEDRLKQARKKYNEKTVNVYVQGYGIRKRNMINVRFYRLGNSRIYNIAIPESLQITDEAEMEAILEVAARNKYYSTEKYGTISFMKAQWITHNLAFSMATGDEEQRGLVEALTGESITEIASHAEELDISPLSVLTDRQIWLYRMVELAFCHP